MKLPTLSATASLLAISSYINAVPVNTPSNTTLIASRENHLVITDVLTWPWRVYKSSSLTPPEMLITTNGKPLADGYVFLTPSGILQNFTTKQAGGFIVTQEGDLVYGLDDPGVTDFRVQEYNGSSHITYWSGYNTVQANIGHGYGEVYFLDGQYNSFSIDPQVKLNTLISPQPGGTVDIHEHQMTPKGTMLLTMYNNTQANLTAYGGPADGWVTDCMVAEVDISSEAVVFLWKASDHIPFSDSKQPLHSGSGIESSAWDYCHINSAQAVGENYLINSRTTWTTYLVAPNGSLIFSFEGSNGGDFGAPPADGTFCWQHFVRAHNITATSLDISYFDNHNTLGPNNSGGLPTRQLVYHLELPARKSYTPLLTRRIETPARPISADSQGSYIADLGNGNQFVGYGQIAVLREYGPATDGSDLRWEARFGASNLVESYRGYKDVWRATPAAWDPNLVVELGSAYVSWNGATEVEGWAVYAGDEQDQLSQVGVAEKKGFETAFAVPEGAEYVQVGALQGGVEVRRSNVVRVPISTVL